MFTYLPICSITILPFEDAVALKTEVVTPASHFAVVRKSLGKVLISRLSLVGVQVGGRGKVVGVQICAAAGEVFDVCDPCRPRGAVLKGTVGCLDNKRRDCTAFACGTLLCCFHYLPGRFGQCRRKSSLS
jgi:hypothetical protein